MNLAAEKRLSQQIAGSAHFGQLSDSDPLPPADLHPQTSPDSAAFLQDQQPAQPPPGVLLRYTVRCLPRPGEKSPFVLFSDRVPRSIDWLWNGYIPRGRVTLLVGDPGVGKSFFAYDLAARISRGERIPPDPPLPDGPGRVLFLSADDDPDDVILPRLMAARADLSRIAAIPNDDWEFLRHDVHPLLSLAADIDRIEYALHRLPEAQLVVIDPLGAYLDTAHANNNVRVHRLLLRLAALARMYDIAILVICHHCKTGASSALHRTQGAQAFTASARIVLTLVPDPAVEGRRLLLSAKRNLTSEDTGRAFAIDNLRVVWEHDPVDMNADQLQACLHAGYATADRIAEAAEWLADLLKDGRRPARDVHDSAARHKIPRKLLYAAKQRIGARIRPDGQRGVWYWDVPRPSPLRAGHDHVDPVLPPPPPAPTAPAPASSAGPTRSSPARTGSRPGPSTSRESR